MQATNGAGQSAWSTDLYFTVNTGTGTAPTIASVTPNPVPGSNSAQQITINGSNYQSGATLTYHDPQGNSYPGHSSTFVNSGQLLDPAFNDASDAGTWTVTVVNPGGQSSTAFNFTVSASTAAPTITSVTPNPVPGSNSAQQITINGSNYQSGATLTYHDPQGNSYPGHSSTFVNSGQLLDPAFNNASDAGTWTVTVVNPGGQSSTAFNFTVSASTAAPTITSVTPNPVPGSNSAQQITINGSNYQSGATLTYHDPQGNSYPGHSSTFVNSGQLLDPAFNDASDAGTWTVTVVNPGGQSSTAFNFTVSASTAAPTITSVTPNPVPGSNSAQQITINGSNYQSGATLTYHDPQGNSYPGHSSTFVNSGQLLDPAFNDASDAGTWTVTVVNPGGQSSTAFNFTVSASTAAPTITSVTPNPVPGSNSAQQITINGSNYQSGATLTYHDPQGNSYPGHSSTFVNSGQLLDPAFNDASDAGTWTVTVVNPGGQSSTAFNFTVSASTAAPTITSVTPNPVPGSNSAQQITINGSNYQSGATLTYHDPQGNSYPGHSSTFVNSGQLLDPAFNDASDAGTWTVTVVNPGGQSSTAFNFTVSASTAAPTITSVTPNPVPGSNSAQQITINGSNYQSGATLTYHDPQGNSYPGHSSTFVNSGQLLDPAFNDASDAGTWTVTVVNPGGQSSTAFNFTVSASTAAPTITSVTPNPVPGSNSAQQITINGSNYQSGATLTYHDPQGNSYPGHSSTFVNSGQLLDPAFNDASDAGTWTVTVVNPGGQSSTAFNFTVQ